MKTKLDFGNLTRESLLKARLELALTGIELCDDIANLNPEAIEECTQNKLSHIIKAINFLFELSETNPEYEDQFDYWTEVNNQLLDSKNV